MPSQLERLLKRQEQLKKDIQSVQEKVKTQRRKEDTRRKILVGSMVLQGKDPENLTPALRDRLDAYLQEDRDRELFGLPRKSPLSEETLAQPSGLSERYRVPPKERTQETSEETPA